MAKPIEATPILKGKDAEAFLLATQKVTITAERMEWLASIAEESKQAEKPK